MYLYILGGYHIDIVDCCQKKSGKYFNDGNSELFTK